MIDSGTKCVRSKYGMYKIPVMRRSDLRGSVFLESRIASRIEERDGTGVGVKTNAGRSRRRIVISEIVAATVVSLAATGSCG